MSQLRVGILGFGYWGVNITRNFLNHPKVSSVSVADIRPENLQRAKKLFPNVELFSSVEALINCPSIDLLAIVTPVSTHYELAQLALKAGKHVLVEKPMCDSAQKVEALIQLAQEKQRVLAVDHTFVYTPVVQKIRELIVNGDIGEAWYFDSVRVNLGLFQHDVNVIWDLAVHDLSILLYAIDKKPIAVSAHAISHTNSGIEDLAYITLYYSDKFIAHLNLNWLAPTKIRQVVIGGSKKMLLWDDLQPSEKLKVFDKGITYQQGSIPVNEPQRMAKELIKYRVGDIWSPALDQTEALQNMTNAMVQAILEGRPMPTSAQQGLEVVRILEACEKSVQQGGARIQITST